MLRGFNIKLSELLNDIMEFCELQYENSQLEYYSHKHPIFLK